MMQDGRKLGDGMEDFYDGMEKILRMEDGKNVFHSISCPAYSFHFNMLSALVTSVSRLASLIMWSSGYAVT